MKTDSVYNSLPDKVRVLLEINVMLTHNDPYGLNAPTKKVYVPKEWLVHGERGHYDEWTWNKEYSEEIINKIGEEWFKASIFDVFEWGIMENIALMLNLAEENGFNNPMEYIEKMNLNDARYSHNRLYI